MLSSCPMPGGVCAHEALTYRSPIKQLVEATAMRCTRALVGSSKILASAGCMPGYVPAGKLHVSSAVDCTALKCIFSMR